MNYGGYPGPLLEPENIGTSISWSDFGRKLRDNDIINVSFGTPDPGTLPRDWVGIGLSTPQ